MYNKPLSNKKVIKCFGEKIFVRVNDVFGKVKKKKPTFNFKCLD